MNDSPNCRSIPLSPQAADEAIDRHVPRLAPESRPLSQCVGRILRQEVLAERDNPPFDRVCMDGIALRSEALRRGTRRFAIRSTQAAGTRALDLPPGDSAIEVMTGAQLPREADMVIPLERYSLTDGEASLNGDVEAAPYRHVQRRGVDGLAGSLMLARGTLLGAPEIAIAASAGLPHLWVGAHPACMVISTGNELIEPGEPIASHQVRRSNVYAMLATLRAAGFNRVGNDHLADEPASLIERLSLHLATHDVLVLSGGVSMGKFDFVPATLTRLGVREIFHKVAQRPGKPLWFGIGPAGQVVFGLPGNPVSTLVCLVRYVGPALLAAAGGLRHSPVRLRLMAPVSCALPLTTFMPVAIECDHWGGPWAKPRPTNGSGDYTRLAGTDGFVELPPGPNTYTKGFVADFYRW